MRNPRSARPRWRAGARILAVALALGLPLAGCFSETYQKGYLIPEGALEQIPIGASQEQVLIVLGTPSTVATVMGSKNRSRRRLVLIALPSISPRAVTRKGACARRALYSG